MFIKSTYTKFRSWVVTLPVLALALLITPRAIGQGSATFSWEANTEADLAGYRFYSLLVSSSKLTSVDVGLKTTYTASGLTPGATYSFYVTARNKSGLESTPSDRVTYTVPAATTAETSTSSVEIILDNTHPTAVTYTGKWETSTGVAGFFGTNYRHDQRARDGSRKVVYRFAIPTSGNYEVSTWYCASLNRASNTPVDIAYSTSTKRVVLNQTVNGGKWVPLTTLPFTAGRDGIVTFSDLNTDGYVIADAVRLRLIPSGSVTKSMVASENGTSLHPHHLAATAAGVEIEWPTEPDSQYELYWSADLNGNWILLDSLTGTGEPYRRELPVSDSDHYGFLKMVESPGPNDASPGTASN